MRMGGGGRKRIVLNGDKEKFVQNRKLLVYGNGKFLKTAKKGLCRREALGLCKRVVFEGNSQGFQKKTFWFVKADDFQVQLEKFLQKRMFLFD